MRLLALVVYGRYGLTSICYEPSLLSLSLSLYYYESNFWGRDSSICWFLGVQDTYSISSVSCPLGSAPWFVDSALEREASSTTIGPRTSRRVRTKICCMSWSKIISLPILLIYLYCSKVPVFFELTNADSLRISSTSTKPRTSARELVWLRSQGTRSSSIWFTLKDVIILCAAAHRPNLQVHNMKSEPSFWSMQQIK
jgi:hypothetical protein